MGIASFTGSLLTHRSDKTLIQLFRYFIVSGISLVIDFGVLYALTEWGGVHYLVSALLSYSAGLIVNYVFSVIWVFPSRKLNNHAVEFGVFVIIGLLGMGINELLMWLLVDVLGAFYLFARIFSAIIGYVWKYVARKWALF